MIDTYEKQLRTSNKALVPFERYFVIEEKIPPTSAKTFPDALHPGESRVLPLLVRMCWSIVRENKKRDGHEA